MPESSPTSTTSRQYKHLKPFTFIFYPYIFSFVTFGSFWSAVICPAWRYWAIAVMEYECHLGGDIFLHRHCATTYSTERTEQEGAIIGRTRLPLSDLSYPDMLWQSINRPLKKPYGVRMPQTRPLLSSLKKTIFKTTEKSSPSDYLVLIGCFDFMQNLNKSFLLAT